MNQYGSVAGYPVDAPIYVDSDNNHCGHQRQLAALQAEHTRLQEAYARVAAQRDHAEQALRQALEVLTR